MKSIQMLLIVLAFISHVFAEVPGLASQSVFYGLALKASEKTKDSLCQKQLTEVEEGVRRSDRWALKMLDASGAPRTGMYWGNTYWLGSKKQCISSMTAKDPMLNPYLVPFTHESQETVPPFPVDYYAAYFYHNSSFQIFLHWDNETKITLGLCLPSSCTEDEVSDYLQEYFDSGVLLHLRMFNMTLTMDGVKKTRVEFSWTDHPLSIIFVISTVAIILLVSIGTIYDIWFNRGSTSVKGLRDNSSVKSADSIRSNSNGSCVKNDNLPKEVETSRYTREISKLERIILSFSLYANFSQVFLENPPPGTLKPLTGLRFAMTNYIIFSHTYVFAMDYYDNRVNGYIYTESYIGQFFFNSSFGVDTFFFMGGFLMVYTLSKSKDMAQEISHTYWNLVKMFFKGIFKRFKRLTPVYMYILVLVFTHNSYKNTYTPFWTNEENDIQCPKYWWTNLLYINNIYPGTYTTMCMSWTYYSSCDMQFFIICSFLLFLSKKHFKMAVGIIAGIYITTITLLGAMTYIDNYRPYANNFYIKASIFYYPPWMRIGPYLSGSILGYIYMKTNGKFEIKRLHATFLWIGSILLMGYFLFAFGDRNFPIHVSILHTALSRNLFVLAMGWVIFACLTGYGGFIDKALSARAWFPVSQLTYTAYLLNPVIVYALVTNIDSPWQFDDNNIFIIGNGLIAVTYIFSVAIVLFIEIPIDKVINILTNEKSTKLSAHGTRAVETKTCDYNVSNKKD